MPEMSKNVDKGLVHIRCCYNNRYWVKDSENGDMITPEEDVSKWSCTLFEPTFNMEGKTLQVRFKHVKLDQPLSIDTSSEDCIRVKPHVSASHFIVVNWLTLLVLPKHVAFKRYDGRYLSVLIEEGDLVFMSDDHAGDPTVRQEIITTRDGSIRLKSDCLNKYWHQAFQPLKLADNIIALRSLKNSKYCRSYKDGDRYYLKADVSTISWDACLVNNGRIYDQTEILLASGEVVNRTNVEDTVELKLSYEDILNEARKL
ncbi:hypothetical protein MKW94_018604 [Papaver nudicaule]|uniref:Agglutinin domain-containing protein n=1 Tax=Papaver nudicaule TaxID=74823 RepID=A0AA42ATB3_PAPNU|nr:hypothetical protein [Papaver nudicaule]